MFVKTTMCQTQCWISCPELLLTPRKQKLWIVHLFYSRDKETEARILQCFQEYKIFLSFIFLQRWTFISLMTKIIRSGGLKAHSNYEIWKIHWAQQKRKLFLATPLLPGSGLSLWHSYLLLFHNFGYFHREEHFSLFSNLLQFFLISIWWRIE